MRPKFHPLTVSNVRQETVDCVSVAFEIPSDLQEVFKFKQGQYLTLRETIEGEDVRRSYSISSGINDGELRVAIKKVDGGLFSTWANENLKKGSQIQVMTPMGNFSPELSKENKKNYLLVAAGSGITPVISIARSILDTEPNSEVNLIYGNRWFNTIIFREELEDLKDRFLGKFRVFHVLSAEPSDIPLFHGRIDTEKCRGFNGTFIDFKSMNEVFVCGPEPMIRAVSEYSEGVGVKKENIHFELFASPGQIKERAPKEVKEVKSVGEVCDVQVILDGQESSFAMPMNGMKILDAAQRNGVDIPFSCKGGMCCTCRAHISEGTATMEVNYALEPGEVENGFVLTCQAIPTSSKIIVDFDKQL
jgi:ring-1,2-phenylacetyl-CoA epoxidase subunit PaaE